MNGSSYKLFKSIAVLLLTCYSVYVNAVPSIRVADVATVSAREIANRDAIVEMDRSRGECDERDAPVNFVKEEAEVSKPIVMLQHEAVHSGHHRTVPPSPVMNLVTKQNSSFDMAVEEGGADMLPSERPLGTLTQGGVADMLAADGSVPNVPGTQAQRGVADTLAAGVSAPNVPSVNFHAALAPNVTAKTLALEAGLSAAVINKAATSASRTHISINETHDSKAHARLNETRKKRYKKQKQKRDVTYWDKLPLFFALASIPLLYLVVRNRSVSSKASSDNDIGDYWDAQRSVGLHSQ